MTVTTPRARLSSEQGFTLVEFMVAALIMSFVLGGTVMLATQLQRSYSTQLDDAALEQEARYALDWIARDLRSAWSDAYYEMDVAGIVIDPNGGGNNDSVQIRADINPPDGDIDDDGEDITIELDSDSGIITRTDENAGDTEEMTDGIFSNLQFTFLDASRTVTASVDDVAFIRVEVTARARTWDTNLGARPTSTLSNEVRVRIQ